MIIKRLANQSYSFSKSDGAVWLLPLGAEVVNFKKELDGSDKKLVKFGRQSASLKGTLLVSGISDNYGIRKKSVFVFSGGKLSCICDMNAGDEKISSSFGLKLVDTSQGKIGILVENDIYHPDLFSSLCLCGAAVIINLYADLLPERAENAAAYLSYSFGTETVLCAKNRFCGFDVSGKKIFNYANENAKVELKPEKCYFERRTKYKGKIK